MSKVKKMLKSVQEIRRQAGKVLQGHVPCQACGKSYPPGGCKVTCHECIAVLADRRVDGGKRADSAVQEGN